MIRFATYEDFAQLKQIWHTCFGDSFDALDFCFTRLQKPQNILLATDENGAVCAALSIEEFSLCNAKAAYIYGVATLPRQQGKGLSTALLNEAHRYLGQNGFACSVLVPAEPTLFDFYEKRGYRTAFSINKVALSAKEIPALEIPALEPLTLDEFTRLREDYFAEGPMFARWSRNYLAFILEDCAFYGGGAFRFTAAGQAGYAVCYPAGDMVRIKELACPPDTLDHVLAAVHSRFGAERYSLYLRVDMQTAYTNKTLPFAMIKWYDIGMTAQSGGLAAYIAHVLD